MNRFTLSAHFLEYIYITPFIKQANVFSPKQNICLYAYINLFIYTT